jgi:multidrug efflux pump subunit AcrA (membrane-fusion protein)
MATSSNAPFLDSSPPLWAAQALAWVLLAIFGAAALALVLVQVPETVAAPFVLVPERGVDPVRTLHDGIVTAVRVTDAQSVTPDTVLFTISSELVGDRTAERAALGTSLSGGDVRLANERQKYENQRRADEQELGRLQQRVVALASQTELKERQVQIAREVAARQQRSFEEGLTSWIEASRPRLEAERLTVEFEETRAEGAETEAAMARLRFEMASRKAAFDELARSVQEELDRARARKGMLDREVSRDGNVLTVRAPCAGTVVRLLVRNPGTVVTTSDVLADIACRDDRLQAELMVPQRGLARLRAGQAVKLRYDAFPYQRYGVRYATLRWISPASSAPATGSSFRALADLDEQTLRINGEPRTVLPGMGGVASIVVGRRSLASYAIEPLRQMREAMATGPPPRSE